jgi:hypothetical protein
MYTVARLGIFVLVFLLCVVLIRDIFVSLVTALSASAVISLVVLRKQRDALAASIATRAERANQRMAERAASEDQWDDDRRAAPGEGDLHRRGD